MKPLDLAALQDRFQAYLLDPAQDGAALAGAIATQSGLPAGDRLAIYYNAYRIRLREALDESFARTGVYLGDELFDRLCDGYVQAHPSPARNMRWYGQDFPAYLAQQLDEHPQVAELGTFEWTLGLAFDAADAPALGADDLRHLAPEDWATVRFLLHPSTQLLALRSNAVAIWLALDKEAAPPEVALGDQASGWLVWRRDHQPQFRSMSRLEHEALNDVRQGLDFGAVCAAASARGTVEDPAAKMAGCLRAWLDEGVLTAFK